MRQNDLYTVGDLSREWGIRRDRLAYAIGRADIQPARRIGITRLFTPEQLPAIKAAVMRVRPYQPAAWMLLHCEQNEVASGQGGDRAD